MRAQIAAPMAFFLAAGCVAALAHPGPDDALRAGVSVERLEEDRAIYVARCSSCHALHLPSDLPAKKWPAEVRDMAEKAKLNEEDRMAIERFLVTMAQPGADAGSAWPEHPAREGGPR
ncbi:MAG TPA: hypothetical protein VGK67_28435 [Myxococcales bacterium]|jgi:hypothetical protein